MKKKEKTQQKNPNEYTLVEHFEELRARIIKCLLSVILCSAAAYFYTDEILEYLVKPAGNLVFLKPVEAFFVRIKIMLGGGALIASPVIIFQIWKFINPGLLKLESVYLLFSVIISFILFITGAAFSIMAVLPVGVKFLLSMGTENIKPMINLDSYISFAFSFMFAFGIIFQLPLVILVLAKLGLVTPQSLAKKRKVMIMAVFIAAAALTPGPDIMSQLLMALPTLFLFEASVLLSYLFVKPEKNQVESGASDAEEGTT